MNEKDSKYTIEGQYDIFGDEDSVHVELKFSDKEGYNYVLSYYGVDGWEMHVGYPTVDILYHCGLVDDTFKDDAFTIEEDDIEILLKREVMEKVKKEYEQVWDLWNKNCMV